MDLGFRRGLPLCLCKRMLCLFVEKGNTVMTVAHMAQKKGCKVACLGCMPACTWIWKEPGTDKDFVLRTPAAE